MQINPGVPDGTFIRNRGGYESRRTPYFLSNEVKPMVVGPRLEADKTSDPQTVRSITSLTQSGGNATATTSVAHGWISGDPGDDRGGDPRRLQRQPRDHGDGADAPSRSRCRPATASPATGTITATGPTVRATRPTS